MDKTTPVSSEDFNQKAAEVLNNAGLIPVDAAVFMCEFIGKQLQGVPSQYRKLAISRLRNKAREMEEAGLPHNTSKLIEAVCKGWENFD